MRRFGNLTKGLPTLSPLSRTVFQRTRPSLHSNFKHSFFTQSKKKAAAGASLPVTIVAGTLFIWWLYPSDDFAKLSAPRHGRTNHYEGAEEVGEPEDEDEDEHHDQPETAWDSFARRIEGVTIVTETEWSALSERLAGMILPDWSKLVPGYLRKLQRELSMAPGSLADEIWEEAHDSAINPEITYKAQVRVSSELCNDEKEFLARRKRVIKVALAKYLGLDEHEIHPDDIPTIAMCGSGGGLRALVAGTGSLIASDEDGLFNCVTYMAGVSGSCWLQVLLNSSISGGNLNALLEHLKNRTSVHIAYPPVAFQSLLSMPTSKFLLSGLVEKLRGDPKAEFGLVDIYGLLLGARFLVPRGELGVNERDFKLSNQRDVIKLGDRPLPIYTVVRHEIPRLDETAREPTETEKKLAKEHPWFQWFEITPYEFFCEEFAAGIPTWAIGRKFNNGKDVPPESGFHLPEIRLPLLMGIFGSAFCATLSHYYKEIKPIVLSISGLSGIDQFVSGRDDDLSKVHPIDPAIIPNFAYQMHGKLPNTTPKSVYEQEHIQLMDAGMSNNLPIYPLLRPGRNVDILVAFDASADIKTDNWLSVADGYARQRGIKGWPLGIGWPKPGESAKEAAKELVSAEASSPQEATQRVEQAKEEQESLRQAAASGAKDRPADDKEARYSPGNEEAGELGYCTVWVGTTQERSPHPAPPARAINETNKWQLTEPDAGLAVVYLPFLANKKGPDISPGTTDFLSTWNFVYTPDQIDSVVNLARANYDEGRDQIRSTVRAVYERKKLLRESAEKKRVQGLEILSS
ncbi:cytosolic phospholipase A2 zeta [Metarhizium rileyi]|uniref:Lysophospholipase n=1 Tax=Metarhizium rileyi (strain RCEF 4871) TaxID=1649241 RepID=A0A167EUW7_METRR|nr:cytosolic phospholipase A2 zeta [Metarhizium rileyi RCEF 4871]